MHLTQIVAEQMERTDFCEDCARTKGVNDPTGFSLADLLISPGASTQLPPGSRPEVN